MQTKRTNLREIISADYPVLFDWRNTIKYRQFVHHRDVPVDSISTFVDEIKRDSRSRKFQFIIESKSTQKPVGLIFTHTYSNENKFCFINVFIGETDIKKWYGIEAFALLLCYLFEVQKLFKVYVEVLESNVLSLSTIMSAGLVEEGRFIGHKIIDGVRYDVIRFAAYEENCKRFKEILSHYQ